MLLSSQLSFALILTVLLMYLIDEWNASEFLAGTILGMFGLMIGLASLFSGFLPIYIGYKPSLLVASILTFSGMLCLGLSVHISMVFLSLYILLAVGISLSDPILITIAKWYIPP